MVGNPHRLALFTRSSIDPLDAPSPRLPKTLPAQTPARGVYPRSTGAPSKSLTDVDALQLPHCLVGYKLDGREAASL